MVLQTPFPISDALIYFLINTNKCRPEEEKEIERPISLYFQKMK